ncbi:hypothetical protein [Flavobacterium denitrificans]|uniref:hypothetical protein n=1 Tax=Flavobacterium denitrificans TaxID=281361 RepID=UPI0004788510|nr:hypothetical protein [Flavobacterium denitrificans]
MAVQKKVLEQKTDKELEQYIKPETRYVPQATKFAFEILKTRGRVFSQEEIDSIHKLINKTEEKKIRPIHENHIKSSNFIFISIAMGLVNFVLALKYYPNQSIFSAVVAFIFVGILGYLIRQGRDLKILLLILFALGLLVSIPTLISDLTYFPLNGLLSLGQQILQLLAIIFLFMIPKKFESIKTDEFELWLSGKTNKPD